MDTEEAREVFSRTAEAEGQDHLSDRAREEDEELSPGAASHWSRAGPIRPRVSQLGQIRAEDDAEVPGHAPALLAAHPLGHCPALSASPELETRGVPRV